MTTPDAGQVEVAIRDVGYWLDDAYDSHAPRYAIEVIYDLVTAQAETIRRLEAQVEQTQVQMADLRWAAEFVTEPEWFPNEGDRQAWQERLQTIRARDAASGEAGRA